MTTMSPTAAAVSKIKPDMKLTEVCAAQCEAVKVQGGLILICAFL